jgi:phosphoribosylanthranilate isomerase
MALKTLVKVSAINNLTDARYCAGMGVEMLGFAIDETANNFIGFKKIEDIIQWVSGVQLVGEIGEQSINKVSEYGFDFIEINNPHDLDNHESADLNNLNIILKITLNQYSINTQYVGEILAKYHQQVSYFLLESDSTNSLVIDTFLKKSLQTWCEKYKILLGFGINKENILDLIENIKPAGIALKGGDEISPGLKDMDNLSEILEVLEVE